MNIYEKLQWARVELQDLAVKKSGKNTFSHYDYFELSDFLPHINRIMNERKFTGIVSFSSEIAQLVLVNSEKPEEQITFTSPMSSANLKGCHDVQNLGAVETYERRYLYTTAFEICESDILDKTHNKNAIDHDEVTTDPAYICEDCGQVIEGYMGTDNKFVEAYKHIAATKSKYGKTICVDCAVLKAAQAKKVAQQ